MAFLLASCVIFVVLQSCNTSNEQKYTSNVKMLSPDEFSKMIFRNETQAGVQTIVAKQLRTALPDDDGSGNFGDLILSSREDGDSLIIREVVVLALSQYVQDYQWYIQTQSTRISSVRVLNFGRERAYTYNITVTGGDVSAFFLIPSNYDPRLMIELYGF